MPALGFKAHIVLLYIQKSVIFSIYISINIDKFLNYSLKFSGKSSAKKRIALY